MAASPSLNGGIRHTYRLQELCLFSEGCLGDSVSNFQHEAKNITCKGAAKRSGG
nr:hypothetical protein [Cressdnaviricota sp.]